MPFRALVREEGEAIHLSGLHHIVVDEVEHSVQQPLDHGVIRLRHLRDVEQFVDGLHGRLLAEQLVRHEEQLLEILLNQNPRPHGHGCRHELFAQGLSTGDVESLAEQLVKLVISDLRPFLLLADLL